MTAADWATIVVAGISGIVSVVGAVFAVVSARAARNSADSIDRRRHLVEALDHEAESFQAAFNAFIASVTRVNNESELQEAKKHVGAALAAASALRIHTRTDGALQGLANAVAILLTNKYYKGMPLDRHDMSQKLVDAEKAGRSIAVAMSTERRGLVAGLNDARNQSKASLIAGQRRRRGSAQ